jgi:hypothetical protein
MPKSKNAYALSRKTSPLKLSSVSSNLLKIGSAAKTLGLSTDTLRRWEKKGFISPFKSVGGTRLYSLEALKKINPNKLKYSKSIFIKPGQKMSGSPLPLKTEPISSVNPQVVKIGRAASI